MASSMSACPAAIIAPPVMTPVKVAGKKITNGTYMAALISAMSRQPWRRQAIHAPIAMAMSVAMTSVISSTWSSSCGAPAARTAHISSGINAIMPMAIASTISM
jgi:hypothetical protein